MTKTMWVIGDWCLDIICYLIIGAWNFLTIELDGT